jgi:hypothetical protein
MKLGRYRFIGYAMPQPINNATPSIATGIRYSAALIAAGLGILLAAAVMPNIPCVSGFALIALGTTLATINRYRIALARRGVVIAHIFVYASLYVLFVGAVCDSAMRGIQSGLSFLQLLDLAASAAVMMLVVRMCIVAIADGGDAPAR